VCYVTAQSKFEERNIQESLSLANKYLKTALENNYEGLETYVPEAQAQIGDCYFKLGESEKALTVYQECIEYIRKSSFQVILYHKVTMKLGDVLLSLRRYMEALEKYEFVLDTKCKFPVWSWNWITSKQWSNIGDAYFKVHKYDYSIDYYKRALKTKDPDRKYLYFQIRLSYLRSKKYDMAYHYYIKLKELKGMEEEMAVETKEIVGVGSDSNETLRNNHYV